MSSSEESLHFSSSESLATDSDTSDDETYTRLPGINARAPGSRSGTLTRMPQPPSGPKPMGNAMNPDGELVSFLPPLNTSNAAGGKNGASTSRAGQSMHSLIARGGKMGSSIGHAQSSRGDRDIHNDGLSGKVTSAPVGGGRSLGAVSYPGPNGQNGVERENAMSPTNLRRGSIRMPPLGPSGAKPEAMTNNLMGESAFAARRGTMVGNSFRNQQFQQQQCGEGSVRVVNGTFKIRKILNEINQLRSMVKVNSEDIGDSHFRAIRDAKLKLEAGKEKAASAICAIGEKISVESQEVRRPCVELVEALFKETDQRPGNATLMDALMRVFSLDIPGMCVSRQWHLQAAHDGSHQYLAQFLALPQVAEHVWYGSGNGHGGFTELLTECKANVKNRCKLLNAVLRSLVIPNRAWFYEVIEVYAKNWQELFELIANKPPSQRPQGDGEEDEPGRQECLEAFFTCIAPTKQTPVIAVDFMRESSADKQTVFSRAARQGDPFLLQRMMQTCRVTEPEFMKKLKKKSVHEELADQDANEDEIRGSKNLFKKSSLITLAPLAEGPNASPTLDINSQQSDGTTALMQATAANHEHCVAMLCKHPNIDVTVKHPKMGHVLQIAISRKCSPKVIEIIRNKYNSLSTTITGDGLLTEAEIEEKERKRTLRQQVVDGTQALRPMLVGARPQFGLVYTLIEENADPKNIREQSEHLERAKTNLSQKIVSLSDKVTLETAQFDTLVECMDCTVKSTDRRNGSLEFLEVCFKYIYGVEWARMIIEKKWLVNSCDTASLRFVGFMLQVPYMKELLPDVQLLECLTTCAEHQTVRIPLIAEFLKNESVLRVEDRQAMLIPFFNKFFADIASQNRAHPREDRGARMDLLKQLINNSTILIDAELEETGSKDKQTIFSRAAQEGDVELVKLLMDTPKVIRSIDRLQSDNTTALQQAVSNNQRMVVEYLLTKGASPTAKANGGSSAFDMVQKSGNDPQIEKLVMSVAERGLSGLGDSGSNNNGRHYGTDSTASSVL